MTELRFMKFYRRDVPTLQTIYLEQARVSGQTPTRYRVSPRQAGLQVLVDAISGGS